MDGEKYRSVIGIWMWNKSVLAWEYGIRVGWMGESIDQ